MSQPWTITDDLPVERLVALRDHLASYCGVYLDDTRRHTLRSVVAQRAVNLGQSPLAYTAYVSTPTGRPELQQLAEQLLNHETVFFRNRPHMNALKTVLLPELHRRLPKGAPIRIWSAGCATGEEPYSIAMTALEVLGDTPTRPIEILGSDLSEPALERARLGFYRGRTLTNLSKEQQERFFEPRSGGLVVNERVRRLVRFEQRNLLEPFPSQVEGVHMIFCQNVTIYFQLATCRDLIGRFHATLADWGLLFLGFSETLWNIYDRFRWREVAGTYVYYKEPQQPPANTAVLPAPAQHRQPKVERTAPVRPQPRSASPEVATRGRALLDAGQVDAALDLFYDAPLADAQTPQILALTAHGHANRGDLDLAAAEARRALELDPLTTEAYVLIGLIYARQNQPSEAIQQLERARYLDANSPLISFHLAECYRQAERRDGALREYRNTIRKLASHPPDQLIDGVAVSWLTDTCRRYVTILSGE